MNVEEYARQARVEQTHWWFQGMLHVYATLVRKALRSQTGRAVHILDLGSGPGETTRWLEQFGRVTACDISGVALALARRRTRASCVQADAAALPFQDSAFDMVTAFGLIEHLAEDRPALREMARVCRPGGWMILLTSAYSFLWSHHDRANRHYRRYTASQLDGSLREALWVPQQISYINTLLFPLIALIRMVQRSTGIDERLHTRDIQIPPAWINSICRTLLQVEAQGLRLGSFPFGVSLVSLSTRASC